MLHTLWYWVNRTTHLGGYWCSNDGSMRRGTGADKGPRPTWVYATTRAVYEFPVVKLLRRTEVVVAFSVIWAKILLPLPLIWICNRKQRHEQCPWVILNVHFSILLLLPKALDILLLETNSPTHSSKARSLFPSMNAYGLLALSFWDVQWQWPGNTLLQLQPIPRTCKAHRASGCPAYFSLNITL